MNGGNSQQNNLDIYRLIFESLEDYAVFAVDKNDIVTVWSRGAEKIMLYKTDEIIGKSGELLFTPEDIKAEAPAMELGTAFRDGKAINERFHVKKDGTRFWGSGLVFPLFDKEQKHIGFSKIMRNVSDQGQAENNLNEEKALAQIIVSTYDEPVVILNTNLEVVNATFSFIQYFSLDKNNIIGKPFYQIMDGGINMAQLRALLDDTLKNYRFHESFEIDYTHPQRSIRRVLVKPRRIYQPPNLLFSLQFDDLTDNKAILHEKDVFISVASHEIRTPVTIIKAYGQILERELKNAKPIVIKSIKKINEQSNNIISLISVLLDTTKITTGKLVLNYEVFDLLSQIKEITEGLRLTQSSHEIKIVKEAVSVINADKVRTGSVVTNLISNAIKYSPNGKEVLISIETNDNFVKVSVQDFGIGIPKNEQYKLFQRFGRTESIKKSRIPGTGLGLHLAKEIIKMQGGDIGFTTEEGKGSTFYFTLPLADPGIIQ